MYSSIEGLDIDVKTGKMGVLFKEARSSREALFSPMDVDFVLRYGIGKSFFSLEEVMVHLPLFPFSQLRFFPEIIEGSSFLDTLLHADYILKMLSIGVKINAAASFEQRPSEERLLGQLPRALAEAIKQRVDQNSCSSFDRIWIEAGDVPLFQHVDQGEIKVRLGTPRISFK